MQLVIELMRHSRIRCRVTVQAAVPFNVWPRVAQMPCNWNAPSKTHIVGTQGVQHIPRAGGADDGVGIACDAGVETIGVLSSQ
jgi:hypothetical protein